MAYGSNLTAYEFDDQMLDPQAYYQMGTESRRRDYQRKIAEAMRGIGGNVKNKTTEQLKQELEQLRSQKQQLVTQTDVSDRQPVTNEERALFEQGAPGGVPDAIKYGLPAVATYGLLGPVGAGVAAGAAGLGYGAKKLYDRYQYGKDREEYINQTGSGGANPGMQGYTPKRQQGDIPLFGGNMTNLNRGIDRWR